jgi:hypothetical protein
VQAELSQQRAAAAAAEERASAAAEEAAALRSQLEAARTAPTQPTAAEEPAEAAAQANGHADNGTMAAEEQVTPTTSLLILLRCQIIGIGEGELLVR